jgi:hypothetical protein
MGLYLHVSIASSSIIAVSGTSIIQTFGVSSNKVQRTGYEMLCGFGLGISQQTSAVDSSGSNRVIRVLHRVEKNTEILVTNSL